MLKYFLCFCWLSAWMLHKPGQNRVFNITGRAQGTTYSIKYVHEDSLVSKKQIDSIFRKIDSSLSLYLPGSLINRFNRTGMVKMDEHLGNVVRKSLDVNLASGGAFDITVKPLVDLWGFGVREGGHAPRKKEIRKALRHTGPEWLVVRNDSLLRRNRSVQIDCNGIAQGYTVDVIVAYLNHRGIKNCIVEVGGEVRAKGSNADGEDWKVGIESPGYIAGDWHAVDKIIVLPGKAVTTSGSYRKYFMDRNGLHGHVIDPHNGQPVSNGIIAVTVVAEDAMTADAWDNGFFVMGLGKSFEWLEKHPGMGVYVIYADPAGNVRDTSNSMFAALIPGH